MATRPVPESAISGATLFVCATRVVQQMMALWKNAPVSAGGSYGAVMSSHAEIARPRRAVGMFSYRNVLYHDGGDVIITYVLYV